MVNIDLPKQSSSLSPEYLHQLATLFSSAAVFAVDKDRKIIFWSSGAEQLLGYRSDELLGENCLTGNRCQQCIQGCGIKQHGQINGYKLSLYDADGNTVEVKKYACSIIDDNGAFNGGVEVLIPVDESFNGISNNNAESSHVFHGLLSADQLMQDVFNLVTRVAQSDVNVLVRGESGTGKELIARAIHAESPRRDKPFMALNCASLSATLLESELFGHVKGAFTDAIRNHVGLVTLAEGGTLFLDEVAEIPLDLQAKLLRVIQEREYTPVGSNKVVKADIRILAATHQSLRKMVHEGRFREDLMYRLRVVPLFLPPLRDRKGDIPLLLNHFMQEFEQNGSRKIQQVHPDAMRLLLNYEWPGNVRELKNVLEYANAVSRTSTMTVKDLPPEFLQLNSTSHKDRSGVFQDSEIKQIKAALNESEGDLSLAAKILGMSRTTLWRKRKKYSI